MPFDEYFSSKVKGGERVEAARKRVAYAKALQFRKFAYKLPKAKKELAMKSHLNDQATNVARFFKKPGMRVQIVGGVGGKSLVGFKEPKKIWDEKKKDV